MAKFVRKIEQNSEIQVMRHYDKRLRHSNHNIFT